MRKRRKHRPNQRQESAAPQLDATGTPDMTLAEEENEMDESDDDAELDAGSFEESVELEALATPDELPVSVRRVEAIAGVEEMAGIDGMTAMEEMDPSDLETMDEFLAELLAQDGEIVAAPEGAPEVLAAGETLASAPAMEATPAMESVQTEEPEGAETPAQVAALLPEPEPELELEQEPGPVVLLAPEPDPNELLSDAFDMDLLISSTPQSARQDGLNALLDETGIPEPPAPVEAAPPEPAPLQPLAPQPPLESVLGSIDYALESAPSVVGPAESSYSQVHHQKQYSQLDDYVVFALAGSDYAVPVRDVAEIGRVPGITRVPNVPEFVRGITNLRGEVVPVLNLPLLLGLQEAPLSARGRVLFLQARAQTSSTGLLVDEVKGIQRIQSQQLEQVTGLVDDKITSVLRGVHGRGDRLLNVLDLEQLFQLQEFRGLESL